MEIGIIDQDAFSIPIKDFIPNLEVMKISSYYKKNKNIVSLLLNLEDNERYSKLFLRKDNPKSDYYSSLILDKRCSYGGLSFTNGIYAPLEDTIENSIPDISIYDNFFKRNFIGSAAIEKQKRILLNSNFIRLSTDNINCNENFKNYLQTKSHTRVYVYDTNILNIKDSIEVLDSFPFGFYQKVYLIHPIKITSIEEAERLCSKKWYAPQEQIIFSKDLSNKEFKELCKVSKRFSSALNYKLGVDKSNNYGDIFLKNELIKILNRLIYIKIIGAKIKILVNKDIPNENYYHIFKYLDHWIKRGSSKDSFSSHLKKFSKFERNRLIEIAENDSQLRELINVVPNNIKEKGGIWLL